jgi:hypothetical protein
MSVNQEIIYHNPFDVELKKIKLLSWISAYKNRKTPLLKRLLQDRKKDMYFAKPDELGNLENLNIKIGNSEILEIDNSRETIYIPLVKPLKKGESAKISLSYNLQLPKDIFTGYGFSEKTAELKYFFIVPDSFETPEQKEKQYINIEENQNANTFWKVILDVPAGNFSKSNLPEIYPNYYSGILKNDPEFSISETQFPSINAEIDGKNVLVDFGFPLSEIEKQNLEFYLPLQIKFIRDKTGLLAEKIFIGKKFKTDEDFIGNDDIRFWKFHYKLFTDAENTDLDYFGIIAKNTLNQFLIYDKNPEHWLVNGLKTYLEIQYIRSFYENRKLLGDFPDQVRFLGLKPLKWFYISKLKLSERYGLGYQYIKSENFDQKIGENFSELSNFNKTAISNFEIGSLLNFVAEKMGNQNFENFLKTYFEQSGEAATGQDFLNQLSAASNNSSAFIETLIQRKQRINFSLKSYKRVDDFFRLKITKNTDEKIPLKIETQDSIGEKKVFWFLNTDNSKKSYYGGVPVDGVSKILINSDYSFPESNFRDNYLYTKGLFSNAKKLKIKLFRDVPNPEYNEVYLSPRFNFNAYDNLLLGMNFKNSSLFRNKKFAYYLTPYYSFGEQKITGTGNISYTFMPPESFFRFLQIGISGSHYHYDYGLGYQKFSTFAGINFTKNPRSDISRSLGFSYNYYQKDLNPQMILDNEYAKYNLWNLNYSYADQSLIHENYVGGGLQWMEDFWKISGEAYYRYEYAKNKKISLRLFAGYFLNNKTKNNLFDFGISRISNYAFSYGLLGQSATSGILAQQFVLADGGFKSLIGGTANQWMVSTNMDAKIWKWFSIYADAGMFKNRNFNSHFIWDSGVKVAVIPDFLELYFPVQSTLGFEPSLKYYGNRIRFTLVFNPAAVANYIRRGVF